MSATITFPDNLTIGQITQIYEDLKPVIEGENEQLMINASAVDSIDTAGLQLLLRIKQVCVDKNISFSWDGVSDTVKQNSEKLGMNSALDF